MLGFGGDGFINEVVKHIVPRTTKFMTIWRSKMITKVMNSKKTSLLLTMLLLITLMLTYGLTRSTLLADNEISASSDLSDMTIVYFIPEDEGKIESRLTPDSLSRSTALENHNLTISTTSRWENARDVISSQNVKAILIHHAAFDLVNRSELQDFFENEDVVVTGVGIPGLELAEFLEYPALFTSTWPADAGYTTPYYFYTYSLTLSGSEKELQRLKEIGWTPGEELPSDVIVSDSFGVTYRSSTDSLLAEGSLDQLFGVIGTHLISTEP